MVASPGGGVLLSASPCHERNEQVDGRREQVARRVGEGGEPARAERDEQEVDGAAADARPAPEKLGGGEGGVRPPLRAPLAPRRA